MADPRPSSLRDGLGAVARELEAAPATSRERALAAFGAFHARRQMRRRITGSLLAAFVFLFGITVWRYRAVSRMTASQGETSMQLHHPLLWGVVLASAPISVPAIAGPAATPPAPVYAPAPQYSPMAMALHFQGKAMVEVSVDAHGQVTGAKISGPTLGMGLDALAVNAVERWQFRPATQGGLPVAAVAKIPIQYSLPQEPSVAPPPAPAAPEQAGSDTTTAPQPLYVPNPAYTEKARADGIEGSDMVQATVSPEGKVTAAELVGKGLGDGLDEIAVATVKTWRFDPARHNGVPIAVTVQVDVEFHLGHL